MVTNVPSCVRRQYGAGQTDLTLSFGAYHADAQVVRRRSPLHSAALGLLLLVPVQTACAYSVLTHEAIVDSTWDSAIRPLLLKRFPAATADELTQAHAYAYGGCIIQDLGYYPFGSKFFSDLTHYVRSGDFILNLIRDSQDLNEYAFALGALVALCRGQ